MKTNLFKIFLLLIPIFTFAQIPEYYSGINFNLSPPEIKWQLQDLITSTHIHNLQYTPEVWAALLETDEDPDIPSNVLLLYGYSDSDNITINDRSRDKDLICNFSGNCTGLWNREHVYARSWGTPNLGFENAGADAHAIRASDSDMNSYRSNRLFDYGDGFSHITPSGNFYPGDEWKGDVARMIMYMYLRYSQQCLPSNTTNGTYSYNTEMPDIYLDWNAEDPPSEYELQRNDILEQYYQGNRNPFIDNPFLATIIWGGPSASNPWELSTTEYTRPEISVYPNPTNDYIYYHIPQLDSVRVYNIQGKLIYTDAKLNDNKTMIPPFAGTYLVEFCIKSNCRTIEVMHKPN